MTPTRVKWYAPLDRLFGPEQEFDLAEPVTVAVFLTRLGETHPDLVQYLRFGPKDTRPRGLMVLRGATTLTLADLIEPGDKVDILVGIQGG